MGKARFNAITLSVALVLVATLSACGGNSNASGSPTATSSSGKSTANLNLVAPGVLTVGSDTSYPPMESRDPNNPSQYVGADVDLANALAKQMGLSGAKIVSAIFDSLIPSLHAKRFDVIMSSMNHTPERAKTVDFVDYMTATEGILVTADSSIHANAYSDLCGKTVAVERGTTEQAGMAEANKTCSSKINILAYSDDATAFQSFAAGHTDAYTSDLPVITNYVKKFPSRYKKAGTAIKAGQNYGIAVLKTNPTLKSALQKALKAIMASGEYMKILQKWGVSDAALK